MIVDSSLPDGRSIRPCSTAPDEFCLVTTYLCVDATASVSLMIIAVSAFQLQHVDSPSVAVFPRNNDAAAIFVMDIHTAVQRLTCST